MMGGGDWNICDVVVFVVLFVWFGVLCDVLCGKGVRRRVRRFRVESRRRDGFCWFL